MSAVTLNNETAYVAQYVVKKGEQVIARIPGIAPGAMVTIPTNNTYEVTATTVIDGNTYTSAPQTEQQDMGFLAQVVQSQAQGTYEFDVQQIVCTRPNTLQFQKTCLGDVIFTISKDGAPLQNVLVSDSFLTVELELGDTFSIYAVINGVTTDTTQFSNPQATITAICDTSTLEAGVFELLVN